MIKVSVLVTTYNRKEYLTETINSILNQTFTDFELIVIDNYSNYDFLSHINSFSDSRIRPFRNKNNGIIAVNRNFGIKKSKGEFIAFCDDDDIWLENKLEIQYNQIMKSGADLISSNMSIFEVSINNILRKTNARKPKNIYDLLWHNQIFTSTVLVKNSKNLLFNEDNNVVTVEDYKLWINLMSIGCKFDFVDKELIYYRMSDKGAYMNNFKKRNITIIYLYKSLLNKDFNILKKTWILFIVLINTIKHSIKVSISKYKV